VTPRVRSAVDVVVVGSGFAGTILARIARRQGLSVALVERGHHPRFALGESATPLADFALERLAARWGLPDLRHLSSWGRWRRHLPHLRCGLKRGFTFYHHRPGREYGNDTDNSSRLLVAASPDDEVADTHWLRADVDAHLVERASAEGVQYLDETTLDGFEPTSAGVEVAGSRHGRRVTLRCRWLADASGRGGFLAAQRVVPEVPSGVESSLVFAHVAGARRLAEVAPTAAFPPGPYPDERAAVHHLLAEGWIYVLPFDDGVASMGLVITHPSQRAAAAAESAEATWRRIVARYPSLAAALLPARPLMPWRRVDRLPHRLARAAGESWFLLPHAFAFFDPLFSTGIAWSLLAVERLAAVLAGEADAADYGPLLACEADQVSALIRAAHLALDRFPAFVAVSMLYFAAASWAEVRQRLGVAAAGEGFLGVGDPQLEGLPAAAEQRLAAGATDAELAAWATAAIAGRNLAGLGDPRRRNLYPLDPETVIAAADLLALPAAELRALVPRLRS